MSGAPCSAMRLCGHCNPASTSGARQQQHAAWQRPTRGLRAQRPLPTTRTAAGSGGSPNGATPAPRDDQWDSSAPTYLQSVVTPDCEQLEQALYEAERKADGKEVASIKTQLWQIIRCGE